MQFKDEETLTDRFLQFYRDYCRENIGRLAQKFPMEDRSLYIEYDDLYRFDQDIAHDWLKQPDHFRDHAEAALYDFDLPVDIDLSNGREGHSAHVRLTDTREAMERHTVAQISPNNVNVGELVAVSGQLSKVTESKFLLVDAAFECLRCGTMTYIPQTRTTYEEPHECQGCERQGPFRVIFDQSEFVEQRKLKLEQPPSERSGGQGQSLTVYVDDDLCNVGGENGLPDRAGEQVVIIAKVQLNAQKEGRGQQSPEFDPWLEGHAIVFDQDDYDDIDIQEHKEIFQEFAAREDAIELCANSIAPELMADEDLETILEASVAWLFNSYRIDPDGMGQYRGDLHMCVIGDPGLGKSTLLSNLHDLAIKSEYRSGTGLSKVGLTASAVQEEFAGTTQWTLEPGVLPRANGGHCIIDEVDDVVDEKTKAIHDALEGDQMVKMDKAGITADLPTRTALLASGNPKAGRFDKYAPLPGQIDLDPALISRMDLLFAMQDVVIEETDRKKAEHILEAYDEMSRAEVYERGFGSKPDSTETTSRPVPRDVFRAWLAYARENVFPTLSPEAKEVLKNYYVEVRNLNDGHSSEKGDEAIPATPRTLEAGVRLATAFARVELSETVELEHAERAINISRKVVGLNYDPETGEFDQDKNNSGTPKSERDRVKDLREIITQLEANESGAPLDKILKLAADSWGKSEDYVLEFFEKKLRRKGEVYEPETDCYRLT